ncbi:MAG: ComEC family competence protein [Ignavibacteria bacterium]|nr:ComEC family competence protein [Ignavibacteria bacterium]
MHSQRVLRMHHVLTKTPTLWISLFIIFGMLFHTLLDEQIDASMLMLACCLSLIACCIHTAFKTLSSFLLGMMIFAETETINPAMHYPLSVRMKGVIKGRIMEAYSKHDSSHVCIIKGYVDTPEIPRIEDCRIHVRIRGTIKPLPGMIVQCNGVIANPKNPNLEGEFNERDYAISQNLQWLVQAQSMKILDDGKYSYHAYIHYLRTRIKNVIRASVPIETQELSISLLLGDTSGLSKEMRESFALLGTAHILSVSGFHAGIIALILQIVLAWIPSFAWRTIILIMALTIFLCIVEWDPPATRACMMVAFAAIARANQRNMFQLHGLILSLSIMLSLEPPLIRSIGFQMSALGMLGLILLYEHFMEFNNRLIGKAHWLYSFASSSLSMSLSASCMLIPLTAWYFNMISLISPIANLILIPAFTLSLCWLLACILCTTFSTLLATTFGLAMHQVLMVMLDIHRLVSSWNWIAYKDHHAFPMATCIVFCIFFVAKSRTLLQVIISSFTSSIFILGVHDVLTLWQESKQINTISIIERNEVLAMVLPGKNSIVLLDRDIHHSSLRDNMLLVDLSNRWQIKEIYYAGKIARKIAGSLSKNKPDILIHERKRSIIKQCYRIGKAVSSSK